MNLIYFHDTSIFFIDTWSWCLGLLENIQCKGVWFVGNQVTNLLIKKLVWKWARFRPLYNILCYKVRKVNYLQSSLLTGTRPLDILCIFGWGLVSVSRKYLIFARARGSIYVLDWGGPHGVSRDIPRVTLIESLNAHVLTWAIVRYWETLPQSPPPSHSLFLRLHYVCLHWSLL